MKLELPNSNVLTFLTATPLLLTLDNEKDYAELKQSLRKNFKKITADGDDELLVGNLEARHAIEQAFLNDIIPDDLQWQAILLAG